MLQDSNASLHRNNLLAIRAGKIGIHFKGQILEFYILTCISLLPTPRVSAKYYVLLPRNMQSTSKSLLHK